MPLSDDSFRLETGARPPVVRMAKAEKPPQERIGALEERLDRLETGQRDALDLVRRALVTLQEAQADQNFAHNHAIEQLTGRLSECESTLRRLDARQVRDDEAMRERLFDIGETLNSVRATAMAAVRPGALRKLERSLGKEIEASAGALRGEFGEWIAEAVEAAETRSARALDALEEHLFDDVIELARRFDGLSDTVVKVCLELNKRGEDGSAEALLFSRMPAETAPYGEEDAAVLPDEEEDEAAERDSPGVIPFPPQPAVARLAEEGESPSGPAGVGAVLCAAAARVEAAEQTEAPRSRGGPPRAFVPLRRMAASAGSAVVAVCIMGGLSLLAGPTLGPSFQGAPPAFAHDGTGFSLITIEPKAVTLEPRLTPVLRSSIDSHPLRKARGVSSGH